MSSAVMAILASIVLGVAAPQAAQAQADYPTKPIRLIVPNPPGGTTDVLARLLAEDLTASLGQHVIVDYKPGASGTIGSEMVAKSPPDGYTLVMGHAASHSSSPSMFKYLPYDPVKDFAPVALIATVTNIVVVNLQLPAKSIPELIALAKAKPGSIHFGSGGNGAITHLAGELFKQEAGVDIVHVAYKGSSQAMIDLMAGHIELMFENMPGAIGHVKSGKLRALGVTGLSRSPAAPELPTVAESGLPGYQAISWFGIFAPAGTPKEVVAKLNGAMLAALCKPAIRARLSEIGAEPGDMSPDAFAQLVRAEKDKWTRVIKDAGVKLE